MASENCTVTLVNNTIVNNTTTQRTGGGICTLYPGSSITGRNNIIFYNTSADNSQFASASGGGPSNLTYSCISQDMPGTGNITTAPMFANVSSGDYHLTAGSPCIDTGDPSSPTDPDGTIADMGALYFNQTGISENSKPLQELVVYPPSPNPSCSAVDISFSLPEDATVNIAFYSILGREICSLPDQHFYSGYHSACWDGRSFDGKRVENGIYFCVVRAGGYSFVQRVTML
jgi:hypothetical protein